MVLFAGLLLLAGLLAALPRGVPGIVVTTVFGGTWLSLVLVMTLPIRSERAGGELARRLGQFRHELNSVGDQPTRAQLEPLLTRARELGLPDEEIAEELSQIQASLEAVELTSQIARDALPVVVSDEPLPPGDVCHFVAPVRFGRRRADQFGHLSLTSGWLKFRGALDVSVAWSEVDSVKRTGREMIVALHNSRRELRFLCHSMSEAARAGVLAQHLAAAASVPRHPDPADTSYHASV